MKATCLAIYSRAVNAEAPLERSAWRLFPWCAEWEASYGGCFPPMSKPSRSRTFSIMTTVALLGADDGGSINRGDLSSRFDQSWSTNIRTPTAFRLRSCSIQTDWSRPHGRWRRRAIHLFVPRGNGSQHLDFPGHFTPTAELITLEQNYRSTQPILAAANAVIDLASERFTKNLWSDRRLGRAPGLVNVADDNAQAGYIVETILANREAGIGLKSQAVLFRASHHSAALEVELTRRNIPFVKFGGLKFLEAAHIKDVLAALRWANNPRDRVAGFRVAQLLPGIGPGSAAKLLDAMAASGDPVQSPARVQATRSRGGALDRILSRPSAPCISIRQGGPPNSTSLSLVHPHLERRYEDAAQCERI